MKMMMNVFNQRSNMKVLELYFDIVERPVSIHPMTRHTLTMEEKYTGGAYDDVDLINVDLTVSVADDADHHNNVNVDPNAFDYDDDAECEMVSFPMTIHQMVT